MAIFATLATGPAAGAPRAPQGFVGVVPQHTTNGSDASRVRRGNISQMRVLIHWGTVEPTPGGGFDWSTTDPIVRSAARNGIRILPFLFGTPRWLAGRETNLPVSSSRQLTRWRQFVSAAVRR
jgi:hypothetical protein